MIILTRDQILALHKALVNRSGGSVELRDERMLDSAIHTPFQTFNRADLYPTIIDKAARLAYGLINNHPFVDGNKRIGTHAMLVFLQLNGITLEYNDNELISIIMAVAAGTYSNKELTAWIREHSK